MTTRLNKATTTTKGYVVLKNCTIIGTRLQRKKVSNGKTQCLPLAVIIITLVLGNKNSSVDYCRPATVDEIFCRRMITT